jgi:hypothetical protein
LPLRKKRMKHLNWQQTSSTPRPAQDLSKTAGDWLPLCKWASITGSIGIMSSVRKASSPSRRTNMCA